jgi:hypothetical protein
MNKQQVLQVQKKGSLRWLWMVLVVLGVVLLVTMVLTIGGVVSLSYAESHRPKVGDAINASGQYYKAIQRHDYTSAYNSLNRNATITVHSRPVLMNSVDTLATASSALDTQDGMISSYTATDGNFEQGRNIVDLTMKVTRTGPSYDVHLKLELASGSWKILSADGL